MKQQNQIRQYSLLLTLGLTLIIAISASMLISYLLNFYVVPVFLPLVIMLLIISVALILVHYYLFVTVNKSMERFLVQLSRGQLISINAGVFIKSPHFRSMARISYRYKKMHSEIEQLIDRNENDKHISGDVFKKNIEILTHHLEKIKTDEVKWKEKERIRTWTNQGVARFSELLRFNSEGFEASTREVLKELINYVKASLGAIFILKEGEEGQYLNMIAAHAYNREKIADKRITMGDGLYGAACFEKQTIYMTEIPDNYLEIRSGMGGAQPKSLIIVPLIHDDEFYGIIELASFNEFKDFEKEFIEKVANIYASAYSVTKMSEITHRLLEQSQQQAKELGQQEEELRQNMEEMQSQQEEMTQKKYEIEESDKLMRNIIDLVPFPIFVKNIKRQYIIANREQAKLFNMPVDALLGRSDDELIHISDEIMAIRKSDSKVLDDNEMIKLPEQSISLADGTNRILQTIKVPFVNNLTNNRNILGVSIDYTQQRLMEQELKSYKAELEDMKTNMIEIDS